MLLTMSQFLFRLLSRSSYISSFLFNVGLLRFLYKRACVQARASHRNAVRFYYRELRRSLIKAAASGMYNWRFSCVSWSIDQVVALRLLCYKHPHLNVRLFWLDEGSPSLYHMGYIHWQKITSVLVSWNKSGNE